MRWIIPCFLLAAACAPLEGAGPVNAGEVVVVQTRDYRLRLSRPGLYTVENERGEIVAADLTAPQLGAAYPILWQRVGGACARGLDAGLDGDR